MWYTKAAAVPEEVGWIVDVRCHSQRGFWKGRTRAGPRGVGRKERFSIWTWILINGRVLGLVLEISSVKHDRR